MLFKTDRPTDILYSLFIHKSDSNILIYTNLSLKKKTTIINTFNFTVVAVFKF